MREYHWMSGPSRRKARAYTLIELLVVIGIVVLMVTLVALSVMSMLRGSKMNSTMNLFVASADEARTTGITLRRSVRVDLTRLNADGSRNRLSIVGPAMNENFENYALGTADKEFTRNWATSASGSKSIASDETRCLQMTAAKEAYYWSAGFRAEAVIKGDYETMVQARVKIQPGSRTTTRAAGIITSGQDSGSSLTQCARLVMGIEPAAGGLNVNSFVMLSDMGAAPSASASGVTQIDQKGVSGTAPTCSIHEGIWYRMLLSVKKITPPSAGGTPAPKLWASGKVWVDGQFEPNDWSVKLTNITSLDNLGDGYSGFYAYQCTAAGDDMLVDMRPIRALPEGIRIDALGLENIQDKPNYTFPVQSKADDPDPSSKYQLPFDFPIIFRPDGTTANPYVIRIRDTSTNDTRYISVDPNTGRTRATNDLLSALTALGSPAP